MTLGLRLTRDEWSAGDCGKQEKNTDTSVQLLPLYFHQQSLQREMRYMPVVKSCSSFKCAVCPVTEESILPETCQTVKGISQRSPDFGPSLQTKLQEQWWRVQARLLFSSKYSNTRCSQVCWAICLILVLVCLTAKCNYISDNSDNEGRIWFVICCK